MCGLGSTDPLEHRDLRKNQFNGINDFELVAKGETIIGQLTMGERAWSSEDSRS